MKAEFAQVIRQFEPLTGEPIEETSPAGIQRLVDEQVPEGDQLDYKQDAYDGASGKNDKRDELRKDVTALANGRGGVLVLGVADNRGIPTKVLGLQADLEATEGRIRQVLASSVEPYLEVETVPIRGSSAEPTCLLIVVPRSSRRPHSVRPTTDTEALKYARRGGPHTEWLSESQVADAYRDRFALAQDQVDRLEQVAAAARSWLIKRDWFLLSLSPEVTGEFAINREALDLVDRWLRSHPPVDLFPNRPAFGTAAPEIGARQVVVAGRDSTTVPVSYFVALHSDGSACVAFELEGPGGNPSTHLDRLVGDVVEGLDLAAGLSADVAGAGGTAAVRVELLAESSLTFVCWDPSWVPNPTQLPRTAELVEATATVDLDALRASPRDLITAAALLAARVANHFGEPDGRYLSYDGAVRIQQFSARDRDNHVAPRAIDLGLDISERL